MKIYFIIIIFIFLIMSCFRNQKKEITDKDIVNKNNTFQKIKLELLDNSKTDNTFYEFRNDLINTIKTKDSKKLINLLSKTHFHAGFGGGSKEDFIDDWNLLSDPKNSKIWHELNEVIRLGFYYNDSEKCFVAPAIFSKIPQFIYDTMDPHEWAVIVNENVNIRKKSTINSPIINQLSYEVVRIETWDTNKLDYEIINTEKYPWYKIYLYDGSSGYVYGKFIRTIGDYRLYVNKIDEKWEIRRYMSI